MSATIKSLGIDQLSVDERFSLMQEIWESLSGEIEHSPLSETERLEVDRRLDAHQQSPRAAIPWEQVETEVLSRLRK